MRKILTKLKNSLKKINILIGSIILIIPLLDFLLKWGILKTLFNIVSPPIINLTLIITQQIKESWVLYIFFLGFTIWFFYQQRQLNLVAGEFKDDFSKGLINWEYGGEGWSTEYSKDNGYELSVTNSYDGGLTRRGFTWSDYIFEFETKIISKYTGWIVRAIDRNNYFMIQVSEKKIRPHFRVKGYWIVDDYDLKLKNQVKDYEWFKVKIIVIGNTIDVYLGEKEEHALHYFIPDPGRAIVKKPVKFLKAEITNQEGKNQVSADEFKEQEEGLIFSFPNGRVGFRCSGDEHAHFRKVRVKPIISRN